MGAMRAAIVAVVLGAMCCNSGGSGEASAAPSERRTLPAPRTDGGPALAAVLATRRSSREFGERDLDDVELGQILWAAQGVTDGHRTAPSAGGLYPLTVRVVSAAGVWRYAPAEHALVRDSAGDRRSALSAAALGQSSVRAAPVTLVISAEFAITAHKYGSRAERFATLEAGHVAENVLLTATALGLSAVPVGAFDDAELRLAMDLSADVTPLYLIPIGHPP